MPKKALRRWQLVSLGEEVPAVVSWSSIIIKLILMYQKQYALYRSREKPTSDHVVLCSACTTTQEASAVSLTHSIEQRLQKGRGR